MLLGIREFSDMPVMDARMMNPLQLAHLGDTVWDLLVRSRLAWAHRNIRNMHKDAVACVNAQAQAKALTRILPLLTDEEQDIVRRGKNVHPHHAAPKNQDPYDYQLATALEALVGYLYLSGQEDRILVLFKASQEEETCQQLI